MISKLEKPTLAYLTVCRDMGLDLTPGLEALEDNMEFAKENGFGALEVAAFPASMPGETTKRDFFGETLNLDWVLSHKTEASQGVQELTDKTGVALEAVCYCANTLGNDADFAHVQKLVETASVLSIPNAVIFIGNMYSEFKGGESGEQKESMFRSALHERIVPLVSYANDHGVNVAVENCSMRGALGYSAQSLTSNWFSNPAEWDIVLEEVPGIKFWFDPSHLRNYRSQDQPDGSAEHLIANAVKNYGAHFAGVHLKDGEDDAVGMSRYFASGNVFGDNSHTGGLWIARAPGRGSINWTSFEDKVKTYAPQALIRSVEMEDLDVQGRNANEQALRDVQQFYAKVLRR